MSVPKPGLYRAPLFGTATTVMVGRTVHAYIARTGHLVTHDNEANPITDALPLIVLDLEDHGRVNASNLAQVLREDGYPYLADQIEAQTKPARIPEPAWGKFVRARTLGDGHHEREFLRYKADDPDFRWADGCEQYRWSDLIDPTLIREGVQQ